MVITYGATDNNFPTRQSNDSTVLNDETKGQDSIAPIIAGLGSGTFCISIGLTLLETFRPTDWPTDVIGQVFLAIGAFLFLFSLVILHFRDYRNVISRIRNRVLARELANRKGSIFQNSADTPTLTHFLSERAPRRIHFQDQVDTLDIENSVASNSPSHPPSTSANRPTPPQRSTSVASSLFSNTDSEVLDLADETDECIFECLMPGSPCCGWLRFQANNRNDYNVNPERCDCIEV